MARDDSYPSHMEALFVDLRTLLLKFWHRPEGNVGGLGLLPPLEASAILSEHLAICFALFPDDVRDIAVSEWVAQLPSAIDRAKLSVAKQATLQ